MAGFQMRGAVIDCPGCGDEIALPVTAETEPQSASAVSVLVSVDTAPVRAHVAERHPAQLAAYDGVTERQAAEPLP